LSPTAIVTLFGANAKFWMFTALVAANATSGSASNPHEMTKAAAQATTARLTAILYGPCRPARSPPVPSRRSLVTPSASAYGSMPGTQVTLVESMGKKARFLEEVASTLALDGVEVRNERAEALAHTRRERYDVATARAVGMLGAIVEYLLPFLRVGGDAIAWKG